MQQNSWEVIKNLSDNILGVLFISYITHKLRERHETGPRYLKSAVG